MVSLASCPWRTAGLRYHDGKTNAETDLMRGEILLEGQGYDVKGEVRGCDVVGVWRRAAGDRRAQAQLRAGPLLQGVERLGMTDSVYTPGAWPSACAR